jgi:hypothetical protein
MGSRTTRRRIALHGIALAAVLAAPPARATEAVARALATPVTATWTKLPLRAAADRLSEIGGIAIVVDRRIDPDTLVSLRAEGDTLAAVLIRVAAAAGAEAAAYAGHVRLVPVGRGAALAAAERQRADELRRLPSRFRPAALARHETSWPDGALPREIVAADAARAGIVIAGLDDLPHDHFPAGLVPQLPLADRVDLILAHFDRRIEWKPRIARGSEEVAYPLVTIADADPAAGGGRLLPEPSASPAPGQAGAGATTYTLTVAAPLEELLAALARRFALTLDLDRAGLARVGVAPGEIVRLELRDASRDQVLDAIAKPRRLAWRIEGDTLSVSAAPR